MKSIIEGIQNLWTGYSAETEQYYEKRLLFEWGGLSETDLKIGNINISAIEDDIIHYISIGTKSRTAYVIIPGYGASGAMYYKLMKEISKKYDLYIVDMRGMGG